MSAARVSGAVPDAMPAAVPPALPPEPALEWSVNPWRSDPRRAAAGLAAALGLVLLAVRMSLPAAAGGVLAAACLLALAPAFVPARYRVDAEGIGMRRGLAWERRAWRDLKRAARGRAGVLLSPFEQPSFRDSFRGLFLAVPGTLPAREDLLRELSHRLSLHGL